MNPDSLSFLQKSPDEQADYWLALLTSPFADREQQRNFQNWLAEQPENRIAWQKAQVFEQQLGGLNHEQIERLEQSLSVSTHSVHDQHTATEKTALRRYLSPIPVFACLLVALLLNVAQQSGYFADYRTVQGEQRQIQLSDGSSVLLNTASTLSIDYSAQHRTVVLHGGEACFTVAADARRPFTVITESGQVTALGTAFDVKQVDENMTVTVYQHAVQVAFRQGVTIDRLTQGHQVAYHNQQVDAVIPVNLKQAKAWQTHRLIFADQPLQSVITELNRYRSGYLVILDKQLAAHRVTGVFDSQDPESALATIEKTLALKEFRLTDRLVILTRRGPAG